MTVFIDASALIAIIAGEPEAAALADRLEADPIRLTSAVAVWECVAGLRHSHACAVDEARERVRHFMEAGDIRFVAVSETELGLALGAYAAYGKGRHPAALNMGDCFAYACAKAHAATLLFKGDDFSRTDIGSSAG